MTAWTIDSLKELMDERDRRYADNFTFVATSTAQALSAAQKAVDKAEAAVEKRLEGMNEFRAAMSDKDRLFMPRAEALSDITRLNEKISDLTDRMNRTDGRGSGLGAGWGYLVGGVGLLAAVASLFFMLSD